MIDTIVVVYRNNGKYRLFTIEDVSDIQRNCTSTVTFITPIYYVILLCVGTNNIIITFYSVYIVRIGYPKVLMRSQK